jgi:tetratricopeptide (TPR) repeat protein
MPFQPWSNALGHLVRSLAVDIVAAHVGARGGELVRLVPELQERIPEALAPIATDRESERYVLFAAVADFLQRATAAAPVVIVLDDLHWCAPPTVQLFRHVATMLELAPLMLVGAYRPSDLGADHQMTELIAASHRDTRASRIEMRGLDDDELVELVARAAGHEIDDDGVTLAHALSRETDGNPFFATEILRHLAESGMLRQRDDGQWEADASLLEHGTLPVSVREVVGRRIDRLGPQATRVLRAAAVVGREFDFPILADVTDDDEDDLLNVLDQAVQAAILVNPLADRFSFAHALFAHTLLQSLLPTRRARLHRRVAEALEDRYGDDIGDRIGELAYHWSAAVVPGDVAKAIESARRAAEHALDHLAPDEAIRWYTNALELLGAGSTDEARRCALLVGLGDAQRQAGRAEHRETLLEAARIADRLNDVSLLAAAALANFRGWNSLLGGEDHERVDTIRRALDAVGSGPSATRARLLAQLSNELIYTADFTYRRDLAEEALSLARELADPALLLQVLNVTHHALWVPDLLDTRLRNTAEACVLAETTDDPVARFWASNYRVFACMEAGHIEEVDRHLADATRIAHELGQPTLRWDITGSLSWRAWLRGDLDESERLATLAFEIGEQSGQPDAFTFFGAQLMMIRWAQGRASELVKVVEDTSSSAPAMGTFRAALVNLYCEVGRNDDARAILEAEAATGFRSMPYDGVWLSGLALYAEAATDVSCRPAAEVLLERLRPWCGQVISTGSTVLGGVTHFVGLLELTLGRLDDAHRSLTDAVEIHERLAAPFPLARSQQALGRVLQARGSAGDARRATAVLELALATAQRHGFAVVERRVRALLDRTA